MSFVERVPLSADSQHDGEWGIVIMSMSVLPGVVHCELSGSLLRPVAGAVHVSTGITLMHNKSKVAFCLVFWMRKDRGR